MDQDATWYRGKPRPMRRCVRWVAAPPPPKRDTALHFSVHVYNCGQTAGWIKTPLGKEVDLSPGHIVLDGEPASRERAQQPPSFWPMSIVATVAHLGYCELL